MSCLYILEINPLSFFSFAIIFSHSEGCLFTLLIVLMVVMLVMVVVVVMMLIVVMVVVVVMF